MGDQETLMESEFTQVRRPSRAPWVLLVLVLLAGAAAAAWLWLGLRAARAEKAELAQRVERMEAEKAGLLALRSDLALQVKAKEEELQKLQGTYEDLEAKMKEEIAKGDVRISRAGGRITVDLVDKILFDVGDASVTARGEEVLSRVGAVLAAVEDKKIQVSGHTDDLPIHERLKDRYPTNWELASARATHVVRFLEESAGVPGRRLVAAAYGPHEPVATNKTPAGRARNRRIEIVLTPQLAPEPIDAPAAAPAKPPAKAAPKAAPKKAAAKPAAAPKKAAPAKKAAGTGTKPPAR